MEWSVIMLLLLSGLFVGFINTFAGAAAAVSIALYTALGLPITTANGTNRIPVLFQTIVTSVNFGRQGKLDYRVGFHLGIPTVVGAIIGSQFAAAIDPRIFSWMLIGVLIFLLILLAFNPSRFMKSSQDAIHKAPKVRDYIWFFLIGLYGGCFHIGVGYLIMAVIIMNMGYGLIEANALKGFIVMMYIPFSLAIFIMHGYVDYGYGLVHAAGNIVGSYFASRYADSIGVKFIRWILIVFISITVLDILKIISIQQTLLSIFSSFTK